MSWFEVFQADEQAVQEAMARIRAQYPHADITATVEDGIIVVSGQVATPEQRVAIVEALKAVNQGLAPVVAGGLKVEERRPFPGRRRTTSLAMLTRMEELARRTTQRIYRVQQGETLESVAVRFYADPKAVRLLGYANGDQLTSPKGVPPGTMLTVPEALYHSVAPGETLQSVAERYYQDATKALRLEEANPEVRSQAHDLTPGITVRVPLTP